MDENKIKWSVTIITPGSRKPTVIKDIVADGVIDSVKYRWFALADRTLVEVPMGRRTFIFSKERLDSIEESQRAAAKSGQPPAQIFGGPRPV